MISGSVLESRWARLACSSGNVRMSRSPSRLRGRSPNVPFSERSIRVLMISMTYSTRTNTPTTSRPLRARTAVVSAARGLPSRVESSITAP